MNLPEPEPAAGLDHYRATIVERLSLDHRCADNYARYLAWKKRGGSVDFLPVKLDIENVSRCNFRCGMCQVSDWPHGRRAGDMSLDEFRALIDEQHGLVEIKIQGVGEPTMGGDAFFEMIRYARARGIWVRTTTNASLFHLRDNARKLMDADPNEIQISIDAADAATFECIRPGSSFDRVIDNVRLLHRDPRARRVTKMWTVVQSANIGGLSALVELASELRFTNQVFGLDVIDWGLGDRGLGAPASDAYLAELIRLGAQLGHRVAFWRSQAKYTKANPCPWPFERSYVSSDARVAPCCMVGNPDTFELGAGLSNGFTVVWNGKDYARFREAHLTGRMPDICKGCYSCVS